MDTPYELYQTRCKDLLKVFENYKILNDFQYFQDILNFNDFKEIQRLKSNRHLKRNRMDHKIQELLRMRCYIPHETKLLFATFTLNNKTLELKKSTIEKKLNKFLKSVSYRAIVNEDYTPSTNRLHYHAILLSGENLIYSGHKSNKGRKMFNFASKIDFKIGFYNLEIINIEDIGNVKNYLLKLNNHSNKGGTGGRIRIIDNFEGKIANLAIPQTNKELQKKYNLRNLKNIKTCDL